MSGDEWNNRFSLAVHVLLRLSVAMCFIGHGAFGIRQKVDWLVFFDLLSIRHDIAFRMMPIIGTMDICLGIFVLIRPTKVLLLYMAVWGAFTAFLRPVVGMPLAEAVERAGNVGPAIALLLSTGPGWFSVSRVLPLDNVTRPKLARVLTWTTALLMIGHGLLGALHTKVGLVKHWSLLHLRLGNLAAFTRFVGAVELVIGLAVLRWPTAVLCIAIAVWKMGTEALFITAGDPFWEWIERGGSYGAPLALALVLLSHTMATRQAS